MDWELVIAGISLAGVSAYIVSRLRRAEKEIDSLRMREIENDLEIHPILKGLQMESRREALSGLNDVPVCSGLRIVRDGAAGGWRILSGDRDVTALVISGAAGIEFGPREWWESKWLEDRRMWAFGGFVVRNKEHPQGARAWVLCAESDFPNDLVRVHDTIHTSPFWANIPPI